MKYIIFILLSLISIHSFANYSVDFGHFATKLFPTPESACKNFFDSTPYYYNEPKYFSSVRKVGDAYVCDIHQDWRGASSFNMRYEEPKCKVSNEITDITVASTFLQSVCYQGCVYNKPTAKSGCVSGGVVGEKQVTRCQFVQTASECNVPDGQYASDDNSEDKKKKQEEAEQKQKELDDRYCKTGEYNAKDAFFTKCSNRDANGQIKDPTKDGNGNPIDGGNSSASSPNESGSASSPSGSGSGTASSPNESGSASSPNESGKDNDVDVSKLDAKLPTSDISSILKSKLNFDLFQTSGQCPIRSYTVTLHTMSKTFQIDYKKFCEVLEILGFFVAIGGSLHAVSIITRDI